MSVTKVAVLTAVRDALRVGVPDAHNRVWITIQDAQGNQLVPTAAECPFLTVADAGQELAPLASAISDAIQRVRIRAHVQDLRDVEAPVIGTAGLSTGAAGFQDAIAVLLKRNLLGIAGLDQALVESLPAVGSVEDSEGWFAIVGDVMMRYTFERDDA
jgi:hypothetical protein